MIKKNHKIIKGALAELAVAHKFLKKGLYVSKSLDPSSPFDLVITTNRGNSYLVDVKSISYRKKDNSVIGRTLNKLQKQLNIRFYFTDINGKTKRKNKDDK